MDDKPKKTKCPADKLTREYLQAGGYIVDKAESYNAFSKRKKDLFKFIDFVAIHPHKKELLAIQTTSKSNLTTRIKKAEGLDAYWHWLRTGNPVTFHGWYKEAGMWRLKEVWKDGTKSDLL
jgi:hypothetical protein